MISSEARELRFGESLLTRLFRSYQEQSRAAPDVPGFEAELATHELNANATYNTPFVSALQDNHRSHSDIVEFVSASNFSALEASRRPQFMYSVVRMPDEDEVDCEKMQPPLTFYATPSGAEEERDENERTSWWNPAEVEEVASRVEFVVEHWPPEWGDTLAPDDICVVTCHAAQLTHLRERIHRDERIRNVRVEHVLDAQGAISCAFTL